VGLKRGFHVILSAIILSTLIHRFKSNAWFATTEPPARMVATKGYVAPPLDGVWATAPYLHRAANLRQREARLRKPGSHLRRSIVGFGSEGLARILEDPVTFSRRFALLNDQHCKKWA